MTWQVWSAFVVLETVLCLTPGPAVLFVLSTALTRGSAKTVWSILGIVTANTVYFILSGTGIGAILMASYNLFFAIKWIGAAYLVWLGVSAFMGKSTTLAVRVRKSNNRKRIVVDGARLGKSHAVFPPIRRILSPIPFKGDSIHPRSSLPDRKPSRTMWISLGRIAGYPEKC